MSVREGERELPDDLPEREVTRGWLKASLRATRSEALEAVEALAPADARQRASRSCRARSTNTQIEIMATANLFRKGHRICLEIASLDLPTGVAGATNAEYVPYHICSSKTVLHKIYHDASRPSHLLLPVIPA